MGELVGLGRVELPTRGLGKQTPILMRFERLRGPLASLAKPSPTRYQEKISGQANTVFTTGGFMLRFDYASGPLYESESSHSRSSQEFTISSRILVVDD